MATASTLASDKYFTSRILREAGVPTLGGEYFFLHARHRAHRPAGRERADAVACFKASDEHAFVKPLTGSRGDFAQALHGEAALVRSGRAVPGAGEGPVALWTGDGELVAVGQAGGGTIRPETVVG